MIYYYMLIRSFEYDIDIWYGILNWGMLYIWLERSINEHFKEVLTVEMIALMNWATTLMIVYDKKPWTLRWSCGSREHRLILEESKGKARKWYVLHWNWESSTPSIALRTLSLPKSDLSMEMHIRGRDIKGKLEV